jgi:hypothetical protein
MMNASSQIQPYCRSSSNPLRESTLTFISRPPLDHFSSYSLVPLSLVYIQLDVYEHAQYLGEPISCLLVYGKYLILFWSCFAHMDNLTIHLFQNLVHKLFRVRSIPLRDSIVDELIYEHLDCCRK